MADLGISRIVGPRMTKAMGTPRYMVIFCWPTPSLSLSLSFFVSCSSWSHLSRCSFFSRVRSFQAPEVIGGKLYDTSADVHSFGILYWELITGKMPYGELQNGWQVT